ncbi:MAG: hypothetical protein IAE64_03985 [Flavobacteriales bacterium]|nr:MAG: hypothetical protein F9K28_02800 [Bacteroidota bacterium]KXK35697.1 MAG: hypothetical protein UZ06_CHB003000431 [Chlorobi bacterium OLB6]MBE2265392.1 hypothetical protein [Flavobacteriales bacterium]MBV6463761.1 hypothetical protein [Chlorobiota bacterium]MBW7853632.1 hypothetical protein [Candidatus Kapabacteria bacterium]MCC6332134.1 hypothetical protein [Ignavibacteria bacterium]
MKFTVILAVFLVTAAGNAYPQGYQWEWSARSPQIMPTVYIGTEVAAGYARQTASMVYSEQVLPCCEFTSGTGIPVRLMITAESWLQPSLAVGGGLGLFTLMSELRTGGDTLPFRTSADAVEELVTEYRLTSTITYLTLAAKARTRLFQTPFSVGLELRAHVAVAAPATLTEAIVAPADVTFTGTGSRERTIETAVFDNVAPLVFEPAVRLMYDVPITGRYVISPFLQISLPLNNLAASQSWRFLELSFGVQLSKGL